MNWIVRKGVVWTSSGDYCLGDRPEQVGFGRHVLVRPRRAYHKPVGWLCVRRRWFRLTGDIPRADTACHA